MSDEKIIPFPGSPSTPGTDIADEPVSERFTLSLLRDLAPDLHSASAMGVASLLGEACKQLKDDPCRAAALLSRARRLLDVTIALESVVRKPQPESGNVAAS
ncbi:MAG: hypothetical protein ABR575_00230 [Actinomycetota bacterium]